MADFSRSITKLGQVLAPVALSTSEQSIEVTFANASFGKSSGVIVFQSAANWLYSDSPSGNYFPVAAGVPFALLLPGSKTIYVKSESATPALNMFVGG